MAAARMTLAIASTRFARLSSLPHTNFTRNGALLCSAAPAADSFSMSCTSRNFSLLTRRSGFNFAIIARATKVGSDDVATEIESQDVATAIESQDVATAIESQDVATAIESQDVATEVGSEDVATEFASEEVVAPEESTALVAEGGTEGSKLYVGNLPWGCDSAQLAEICLEFGTVDTVEVIYDPESGRSRGFAFVTMASNEDAQAVINSLHGSDLGGRVLRVNFPKSTKNNPRIVRTSRGRPGNVNKMFVSNFPWACDDEALTLLFSGYGKVVDAKVVYDRETGRSRGYGFVTMDTASEVTAAIENLNGADYEGRELNVCLVEEKKPAPRQ